MPNPWHAFGLVLGVAIAGLVGALLFPLGPSEPVAGVVTSLGLADSDTGSSVIAPGIPMASSIADAMAAPTALTPLSPAPLIPSGLSGDG